MCFPVCACGGEVAYYVAFEQHLAYSGLLVLKKYGLTLVQNKETFQPEKAFFFFNFDANILLGNISVAELI